jgi:hypothetical protein
VLATRVILREASQAVEVLGTISEVGIGSFTAQGLRIATATRNSPTRAGPTSRPHRPQSAPERW